MKRSGCLYSLSVAAVIVAFVGSAQFAAWCLAQNVEVHATPSPTPMFRDNTFNGIPLPDAQINDKGAIEITPSKIKDWALTDSSVRIHVSHEPIVTKEGHGWIITFKK